VSNIQNSFGDFLTYPPAMAVLNAALELPHYPIEVKLGCKNVTIKVKFEKPLRDIRDLKHPAYNKPVVLLEELHERDRDYFNKGVDYFNKAVYYSELKIEEVENNSKELFEASLNIFYFLEDFYEDVFNTCFVDAVLYMIDIFIRQKKFNSTKICIECLKRLGEHLTDKQKKKLEIEEQLFIIRKEEVK
jgi:hypothetical protein